MIKDQIKNSIQENQRLASNPDYSIWVNANAGTGKTKVLVDRILRILLNGTDHRQILCITYTKAAASEINQRIMTILSRWSYIEENKLVTELENLGIENINQKIILNSRMLCNIILDSNIPLKIQTIHGFCQNLLETFFIEAVIPGNFKVLEENNDKNLEIKNEVYNKSLIELLSGKDIDINTILSNFSEKVLETFIQNDIPKYSLELNEITKKYKNIKEFKILIFKFFNANPNLDLNNKQYLLDNLENKSFNYDEFKKLTLELNNNYSELSEKEKNILNLLQNYLNSTPVKRSNTFNDWYSIFFTQTHTKRVSIFKNSTIKNYITTINYNELIEKEVERLQKIKNWIYANSTYEIYKLALFSNKIYSECKNKANFLDYNDLLHKTLHLLNKEQFIPWVFYTLNQRISHILIDEAQDTSPLQWELIYILAKEIFSNKHNKSIFIVGDIKQSIFSFQGAKPEVLSEVKNVIKNLVINNHCKWQEVIINTSFRSSKPILDFVNKMCNILFINNEAIKENNLYHECFNTDLPGLVDILPIIYSSSSAKEHTDNENYDDPDFKDKHCYLLAEIVANKINELLKKGYTPKDIMILVSKRSNNITLNHLIRLLKNFNIPTSGIDKLILLEHLAIMDILCIAKFLLQPLNDLNLATLLKSPIFNFSDNDLCKIILESNRKRLWNTLNDNTEDIKIINCVKKLNEWQNLLTTNLSLYELFNTIINEEKLCKSYGTEIEELLNQFITLVIQFENQTNNPSLEKLVNYLDNINPIISKELDNNTDEVKFLTIHGSKGLESKIIFLLDNTCSNNINNIIQTNNKEVPIIFNLSKSKGYVSNCVEKILNKIKEAAEEENKRLFYVAITRAKEKLYFYSSAQDSKTENKTTRFYKFIKN